MSKLSTISADEITSIDNSLRRVRENGSTSYMRKYRTVNVARQVAYAVENHLAPPTDYIHEKLYLTQVYPLRSGEAVLVVDIRPSKTG